MTFQAVSERFGRANHLRAWLYGLDRDVHELTEMTARMLLAAELDVPLEGEELLLTKLASLEESAKAIHSQYRQMLARDPDTDLVQSDDV
jgi:hypothetical protein